MSPDRKDKESTTKKTERTFLMGEERGTELRWPFRDEEGAWAEEGEETQVKGSAVVEEEEEEESKPDRIQ